MTDPITPAEVAMHAAQFGGVLRACAAENDEDTRLEYSGVHGKYTVVDDCPDRLAGLLLAAPAMADLIATQAAEIERLTVLGDATTDMLRSARADNYPQRFIAGGPTIGTFQSQHKESAAEVARDAEYIISVKDRRIAELEAEIERLTTELDDINSRLRPHWMRWASMEAT